MGKKEQYNQDMQLCIKVIRALEHFLKQYENDYNSDGLRIGIESVKEVKKTIHCSLSEKHYR